MKIKMSLCRICKHYSADKNYTCTAFPAGIPMELLYGQKLHLQPYENDRGIQFEVNPEQKFLLKFFQEGE